MLTLIKDVFGLLTSSQKKRFFYLQFFVVLMSFAEVASVASIGPFMALIANINSIESHPTMGMLYQLSDAATPEQFVLYAGLFTLMVLFASVLVSTYTLWRLSHFAAQVGVEISDRLYAYYLNKDWLFHTAHSSASLTSRIVNESQRFTSNIVLPLLLFNAKFVLALGLSLTLFFLNPWVAIFGVGLFSLMYFLLYKTVRSRLARNGRDISEYAEVRMKLLADGFGGVKDTLLLHRQSSFIKQYQHTGKSYAYALGDNVTLSDAPRFFMECIAISVVILLVIYLIAKNHGDLGVVLPMLGMYGLAGFKLLPTFQKMYNYMSTIKGSAASFYAINTDLLASEKKIAIVEPSPAIFENSIDIRAVSFTYPNKALPAVEQLSLSIQKNQMIGLVGPSGSGKSTLVDILLGLLSPEVGEVCIDGRVLDERNMASWQKKIGFVAQQIFLSQNSIAENIAFGLRPDEIDQLRLRQAIKLAHLDPFIEQLAEGMDTQVGERGVQLSGGQRQRIGIARALYHDAEVLILDEATSALDGVTEKVIMDAISDFGGKKTIIMIAHRLTTVKNCDQIFFIDQGSVIDSGTYEGLLESNPTFRQMASEKNDN